MFIIHRANMSDRQHYADYSSDGQFSLHVFHAYFINCCKHKYSPWSIGLFRLSIIIHLTLSFTTGCVLNDLKTLHAEVTNLLKHEIFKNACESILTQIEGFNLFVHRTNTEPNRCWVINFFLHSLTMTIPMRDRCAMTQKRKFKDAPR